MALADAQRAAWALPRPKGFDPKVLLRDPSPFIQMLGEINGPEERRDPHYYDPKLTGSGQMLTRSPSRTQRPGASRTSRPGPKPEHPAHYLQERFADAGGAGPDPTALLLTSHLSAGAKTRIPG